MHGCCAHTGGHHEVLQRANHGNAWQVYATSVWLALKEVLGKMCTSIESVYLLHACTDIDYIWKIYLFLSIFGRPISICKCMLYITVLSICPITKNVCSFSACSCRQTGEQLIQQLYAEHLPEPWEEEGPWTVHLLHETGPQGKSRFFKIDIWHVVLMGVAKDFVSSAMTILQVHLDGSNVDLRFQHITMLYRAWCSTNKKTKYVSKLTKDTFGGCGKRDEPTGSWNKAALSTTLMQFLEYLCSEVFREECQADERLRFVASCRNLNIMEFVLGKGFWGVFFFAVSPVEMDSSRHPESKL